MTQSFKCPSCGAPLDTPSSDETTMRCPFCNTSVIIPETIRVSDPAGDSSRAGETDPVWSSVLPQIRRLLQENKKIEAIKLYRLTCGVGLKEAKDAVEALERGDPVQISSTTFPVHSTLPVFTPVQSENSNQGCRKGVVLLALLLTVLIGLIGLAAVLFTTNRISEVMDGIPQIAKEIQLAAATSTPTNINLLLSFGEKGMGPGQFQDARSIAVDPQGNIFLAEYLGGRVLIFDSSGNFKNEWNTGDKKAALQSLGVDRSGVLSLVMSGDVLRYKSLTGELINRSKYGGADKSVDYAVGTQDGGMLLIAGGENVWLFDARGIQKMQIPAAVSKINDKSELQTHAAVDGQGNIYLLGRFNNAVFKYSGQGKFLSQFGGAGDQPGQFRAPKDVAVDGQGRVYVTDSFGVQIFDTNGRYLSRITVEGAAFGMTVDEQGNLFVITNKPKVYKFKVNVTP